MDNKVLSIEKCNELISLGINMSNATFYWLEHDNLDRGYQYTLQSGYCDYMGGDCIPTFTADDIFDMLPDIRVNNTWYIPILYKSGDLFVVDYHRAADFNKTFLPNGIDIMCCCETALEATFNMLIWCKAENYI